MTEFKITPEDVGRVAICGSGRRALIAGFHEEFGEFPITGRYFSRTTGDPCIDGVGIRTDGTSARGDMFERWKPKTLEAPKLWWNVYRCPRSETVTAKLHDNYRSAESGVPDCDPIARVYAEHWHGCEEGRFDTPESIGGET